MAELKTLYYLSKSPVDLLIPKTLREDLNETPLPRICFSTSIQGGLTRQSRGNDITGESFKVYTITTADYIKPTLSESPSRDLTEEVWLQYSCEPEYQYDIKITGKANIVAEELAGEMVMIPIWQYSQVLQEDNRTLLVSKSRNTGPYKNQSRGKNRFERKKHSQIAKTVKQYNKIDMNQLFKQDILQVSVPVTGETDNYTVQVKMEGVVKEIAANIKNNKNRLEFRTIIQALTKVFNSSNIWVKCTCADYKYRFAHWNIVNNVSVDDSSKDPGPGKGIRNPNDSLGRGCKHVLLVLANGDWLMKVASVINNYIHYAEKNLQKPFLKLIFPKLYGIPADEMVEQDIIDDDKYLDSSEGLIDAINDYGRNRGKYKPGTNKNPVTGTGGRNKAKDTPENETEPEAKKTAPEQDSKDTDEANEEEDT